MIEHLSEEEVITTITRLSRDQLVRFIEAEFVRPDRSETGYVFRRIDIARLELLCDLSFDLDLDETALGVVISLIDQLHTAHQERLAIERAIQALPADVHARILESLNAS